MRVKRVSFEGFRGLGQLSLDLHGPVTVLVGENGLGKSAILKGIAILLSRLPVHVQRQVGGRKSDSSRPLKAEDITNWERSTKLTIEVEHSSQTFEWSRTAERTLANRAKEGEEGPAARALAGTWLPADTSKLAGLALPMALYFHRVSLTAVPRRAACTCRAAGPPRQRPYECNHARPH